MMLLSIHFSFAANSFEFIGFIYIRQKTLYLLILVINVLSSKYWCECLINFKGFLVNINYIEPIRSFTKKQANIKEHL